MAVLYFEGFDALLGSTNVSASLASVGFDSVPSSASVVAATGRFGGTAISMNGTATYPLGANHGTLVAGLAYYVSGTPGSAQGILTFLDGTTTQMGVGLNASRQLFVYRNSTATVVATGSTTLPTGQWAYIEVRAAFGDAGTYEVRLNGASVAEISGTGDIMQTTNAHANKVGLVGAINYLLDDLYVCDTSGSYANTFLGECRVQTLVPTGAGSSTQFTPSTGANWSCVDEGSPSSADYVAATAAGLTDRYEYGDVSGTPTVFSAALYTAFLKDDTAARSITAQVTRGGATASGATRMATSTHTVYRDHVAADPNGGGQWTYAAINAAQAGFTSGA